MRIIAHFRTITKHRHKVMVHCFKCGIPLQGLLHDLSKYSITEFFNGAKYYVGTRSPNELERQDRGYSLAWMHHKGRNKHHYEYWTDLSPLDPIEMPQNYLVEMFCDRVAASKVYKGKDYKDDCAYLYFINGRGRHMMHKNTAAALEKYLVMLKEKGEEETFAFIRNDMKEFKKEQKLQRKEKRKNRKNQKSQVNEKGNNCQNKAK